MLCFEKNHLTLLRCFVFGLLEGCPGINEDADHAHREQAGKGQAQADRQRGVRREGAMNEKQQQ